jgi:hypothetical protein
MPDGLRGVLAPLRLLADTRDDAAAWMLMRHWGASAGLTSALVAGCARSGLSAWQQVLSWARREHDPTGCRADLLLVGRLVKMTDALQDILEDAPPNLDAGGTARLLNSLARLPARHAKVRAANQNLVAASEAIASRIPAVACAVPLAPLSALRALISEANALLAEEPASPDVPTRHAREGGTAKQVDTGERAVADDAASTRTPACANEPRSHAHAAPVKPADPVAMALPCVIYAPFASPRTLRLLAAGAVQRSPANAIATAAVRDNCTRSACTSAPVGSRNEGVKDARCRPTAGKENPTRRPAARAAVPGGASASCHAGKGRGGDTPPAKKQPGARSANDNKHKKDELDPKRGVCSDSFQSQRQGKRTGAKPR